MPSATSYTSAISSIYFKVQKCCYRLLAVVTQGLLDSWWINSKTRNRPESFTRPIFETQFDTVRWSYIDNGELDHGPGLSPKLHLCSQIRLGVSFYFKAFTQLIMQHRLSSHTMLLTTVVTHSPRQIRDHANQF